MGAVVGTADPLAIVVCIVCIAAETLRRIGRLGVPISNTFLESQISTCFQNHKDP